MKIITEKKKDKNDSLEYTRNYPRQRGSVRLSRTQDQKVLEARAQVRALHRQKGQKQQFEC